MHVRIPALLLLAACCGAADLQSLYDNGQLFDLRDAVLSGQAPQFFRAVVACSFNDQPACVSETKAFLDSKPSPELAVKAYDLMAELYFAHGKWAELLAVLDAEVALRGESEDAGNTRGLCRAFMRHGPVIAERVAHSTIRVLYKNAHVPISVNGRPYHGFIDTGANISVMTEAAAKQLALPIGNVEFAFGGAAGKGLKLTKVAVAERLAIGKVVLRNVPFVVVSDRQQPFAMWGKGKRCILGLQVLLAARTMTWKGHAPLAAFEIARPSGARDVRTANFCFEGKSPLTAGEYDGKRLTLFLDTGLGKSELHAAFAAGFPDLLNGAARKTLFFEGVDGEAKVEAAILPAVSLRIGGRDAAFRHMPVYLKGHGAGRYDGMMGCDLAGKAGEFTIDFEAMRLTMR